MIGVAFIRGISMFGKKNYRKEEIEQCLKKSGIKILMIYGNDNIVFYKPDGMQYATIGARIEKALEKCFGEKFYVTTRSISTIKNMVEKIKILG